MVKGWRTGTRGMTKRKSATCLRCGCGLPTSSEQRDHEPQPGNAVCVRRTPTQDYPPGWATETANTAMRENTEAERTQVPRHLAGDAVPAESRPPVPTMRSLSSTFGLMAELQSP